MHRIKLLTDIKAKIKIPPDKSISHRAVIISSLSRGKTLIKPFLRSEDTLVTINCMRKLGVEIKEVRDSITVRGCGKYFPKKRKVILYAGESGTTMRILSGLLCAQKFAVEFKAAPSLNLRPMGRIIYPLTKMGANIKGILKKPYIYPPLSIKPVHKISGGKHKLPIASAQVKSALMLASLYANSRTVIEEPCQSRDHTERMLKIFGVDISTKGNKITCSFGSELKSPKKIFIPSDFSSAAFFIILGLILKNSKLLIKNININPSRYGLLKVLKRMGAKITLKNKRGKFEPYADILIESSNLRATTVLPNEIPSMIDEVPILGVAATFAKGQTLIRGISELRVKESDRIEAMLSTLKSAGAEISCSGLNALTIKGGQKLHGANFKSFGDHRIAMSAIILGSAIGNCAIDDIKCISKSFPQFISLLKSLGREL